MDLTKQVCSLELAKKLKELGVKQESYFWWLECENDEGQFSVLPYKYTERVLSEYKITKGFKPKQYSAFTVAELGEMLPNWSHTFRVEADFYPDKIVKWLGTPKNKIVVGIDDFMDTEADCRAKCLVYLKEKKL